MSTLYLPFTEDEVTYLMSLVTTDLRRMTEQGDHARSHGTRGFTATDEKVSRGTLQKLLAVRDQAAYEAGVKAASSPPAQLSAPSKALCDGEHAAPECDDKNCWLKEP